jgi:Domain of unknown function (DUF4326)
MKPMSTTVIHVRDMRKGDVYIGRRNNRNKLPESIWRSPFVIGKDGTREEVIAKYEAYIPAQPHLLAQLHTLKGKRLACWCKPEACHGDVLAKLADAS